MAEFNGTPLDGDVLQGTNDDDTLDGKEGADLMIGGLGNDFYLVDNPKDAVVEADISGVDTIITSLTFFTLPKFVENLVLATGLGGVVIGNEGKNAIEGDNGADLLDGKAGADTLTGRGGNDTYVIDNSADAILENGFGEGLDLVLTSVSYSINSPDASEVDNMTATGSGNLSLLGNALSNVLTGNVGNNLLNGNAGADRLVGGKGNDTYVVDTSLDAVVESFNSGNDRVLANSNYSLFKLAQVENISAFSSIGISNINFSGNSSNNILSGNAGKNVLKGAVGNDKLLGQAGDDALFGGAGIDTLAGGKGKDSFVFDTAPSKTSYDIITDYNVKDDTLQVSNDLSFFKAIGLNGKLDANTFVLGKTARDANDHVIYDKATGDLFFDADGSGAGAQVRIAEFTNKTTLTAAEFLIV